MMEIVFWGSLFLTFFAYFGYPFSLFVLTKFRRKEVRKQEFFPEVSFIITAFNEEKRISAKLENTLKLVYPQEKLEVIVASDGSTDRTEEIVMDYSGQGIALLKVRQRGGKENAQKEAVAAANGEILVFSDVATMLEPHGLASIVANFADPSVGCVSSEDRLIGRDGKPSGEGLYVRYEMALRQLETQIYSVVGLSGSFFAARAEVCRDFATNLPSDFRTLLNSIKLGMRGISDPDALGIYLDISDASREFNRKVRTVLRGITAFFQHLELLNPFKFKIFAYEYFCHKLLRWLVPVFMVLIYISNIFLIPEAFVYRVIFLLQNLFYLIGVISIWKTDFNPGAVFKIPKYFLSVNISILYAWVKFLKGERMVMWTPSER